MKAPKSNQEWAYWGVHDPLFAVATLPRKNKDGESPWAPEEILEMGRRYFGDVYLRWQQYGVGSRYCVEIGCGAGRITAGLARRFERVLALDVSLAQIETARRLLGQQAANVTFALLSQPQIPLSAGECDAVFSCEVFQHFDDTVSFMLICGKRIESLHREAPSAFSCQFAASTAETSCRLGFARPCFACSDDLGVNE